MGAPNLDVVDQKARARDEVNSEIRSLLGRNAVLISQDFDLRVRQHLHALYTSGGRQKIRGALEMLHTSTLQKDRDSVRSWPAYLVTLLRKYDSEFNGPKQPSADTSPPEATANASLHVQNETGP